MNYLQFKAKYLGRRIDADGVYGFQCVDLVKQYTQECYGVKGNGNAIDWWYNTSPAILTKFDRLSTSSARRGDIVIFKGVNGNPYGHIGICDSDAGLINVNTLEQNGSTGNGSGVGGDAIRVRGIPRWRVVGVLRQKVAIPVKVGMPAVGSWIHISINRTTFKAGTTTVAGILRPGAGGSNYLVRGYDPKYPNRILINTASGGGNGVALALYYTNGNRIEGWTQK